MGFVLHLHCRYRPWWGFGFLSRMENWDLAAPDRLNLTEVRRWAERFTDVGCEVEIERTRDGSHNGDQSENGDTEAEPEQRETEAAYGGDGRGNGHHGDGGDGQSPPITR